MAAESTVSPTLPNGANTSRCHRQESCKNESPCASSALHNKLPGYRTGYSRVFVFSTVYAATVRSLAALSCMGRFLINAAHWKLTHSRLPRKVTPLCVCAILLDYVSPGKAHAEEIQGFIRKRDSGAGHRFRRGRWPHLRRICRCPSRVLPCNRPDVRRDARRRSGASRSFVRHVPTTLR